MSTSTGPTRGPVNRFLNEAPPEALFVLSATAQYIGAIIAVTLFDRVPPASVAWFRVIGAAAVLCAVAHRDLRRRWTSAQLVAAAVFGIATALMNLFFYLAIDRLPLGKGVAIEFIGPVAVAAARTRTGRNAIALLSAVAGVVVLSGVELADEPLGLLFVFLSSAMWAAYIVVGSRVARDNTGLAGIGLGLAVGAVVITPFGAPGSGPAWTSIGLLAACLVVGVFSNAIGYGIDQAVLRRIPVRRFSVLLALLPVTATVLAFIALDQRPSGLDLAGLVLVLIGVVTQERDSLAEVADPTPRRRLLR